MKALWSGVAAVAFALLGFIAWCSVATLGTSQIAVARSGSRLTVLADHPGLFVHAPWTQVELIEQRLQWLRVNGEAVTGPDGAPRMADVGLDWRVADVQRFLAATGGSMDTGAEKLRALLRPRLSALDLFRDGKGGAAPQRELQEGAALWGVVLGTPRLLRVELNESDTARALQRASGTVKARTDVINELSAREVARLRAAGEAERDALVEANARDAGKVRGDADAEASRIYARAYGKDPQFADFFRSLEAYRKVLGREGDLLVITPDGDFFRYLQKPVGDKR